MPNANYPFIRMECYAFRTYHPAGDPLWGGAGDHTDMGGRVGPMVGHTVVGHQDWGRGTPNQVVVRFYQLVESFAPYAICIIVFFLFCCGELVKEKLTTHRNGGGKVVSSQQGMVLVVVVVSKLAQTIRRGVDCCRLSWGLSCRLSWSS